MSHGPNPEQEVVALSAEVTPAAVVLLS